MTSRTLDQLAADLYGSTPAPQAVSAPVHRTNDELAQALYNTPPAPTPTSTSRPDTAPRARTQDELAEAFYRKSPDHKPALQADEPEAHEPSKGRSQEELADSMYPKEAEPVKLDAVPSEVQELRDTIERRMYSAQDTLRDAVSDKANEKAWAEHGIDPEAGRKGLAEVRELLVDIDFGPREVESLVKRAQYVRDSQPDTVTQREATVEALNREFGNGAAQAWRDARTLVSRDPRTAKLIDAMGLGDDAETVVMLARVARSQIVAGKLRMK